MKKVLIATEKPFAKVAVNGIKKIFEAVKYEVVMLEKYSSKSDLLKAVADVDALIVRSDKVDSEVIAAAQKLKIVVRAGAGYDNIDLYESHAKNIVVENTPGQNSNAVAELAFGMMIYLARNNFVPGTGTELRGKSLGIHAYGNVGRYVGMIAKGFNMNIYAYDQFVPRETIEHDGIKYVDNVEDLYKNCQYISLHIPANEKTVKSINWNLISLMPNNATLVNTARKEIIDEDDLLRAFHERSDFKYCTDIAPNCIDKLHESFLNRYYCTPKKMGAETVEANINSGLAAANQIVSFFEKGDTKFQVNL